MPSFKKKDTRFHFSLTATDQVSAHGGQVLIDRLARRFDLWDQLAAIPGLDPRKRRTVGFTPAALSAQIVLGFTSGAVSLSDMERLGADPVLLELVGLRAGADQSTLGEWLRAQTPQTVEALMEVNRHFVAAVWQQAKPARVRHAGRPLVFFDDTEIEVEGRQFEGARLNYEGNRALSFQTLWLGPLVADAILDGAADPSQHLEELLGANAHLWAGQSAHFYADSASSAAKFLRPIEGAGFGSWSVSYNKWTTKLEQFAAERPESQWTLAPVGAAGEQEGYTWIQHQPGESEHPYLFATVRRKEADEMLWRYGFVAYGEAPDWGTPRTAQAVLEHHRLKGACEQGFSHLLSDLDLHHPPCESLVANQMFYALGILAYNLMIALRLLDLPDDTLAWRPRTLIRHLLTIPVKVSLHARYRRATLCVPAGWMRWWRLFLQEHGPKRTHGGARIRLAEDGL